MSFICNDNIGSGGYAGCDIRCHFVTTGGTHKTFLDIVDKCNWSNGSDCQGYVRYYLGIQQQSCELYTPSSSSSEQCVVYDTLPYAEQPFSADNFMQELNQGFVDIYPALILILATFCLVKLLWQITK